MYSSRDAQTRAPSPAPGLRRELSLLQVSLAGIGTILGAGIYVLVGEASGESGGLVWAAFIVAGLTAGVTGLSYAELSAMYPGAGASFEYVSRAFNIHAGFITGWLTITAEIVAAGAVALGFGGYLEDLTGLDPALGAIVLLTAGTMVAASGALGSVWLAGLLTVVEAAGLLLISAIGAIDFDGARVLSGGSAGGVLGGAALVFFAYIGFEDIATFSEEAKDPERTLPRAILIALLVSTVLYILVALTAVGAVGAATLAGSDAPLAVVAERVLGGAAGDTLGAIALAATGNTALLLLMASCRRIYGMASAGALPRRLASVNLGTGIPLRGLVLVGLLAAAVSLIGDLGTIADVTNFALFVAFALVNASVIVLRRRRPRARRPFRVPGTLPRALGAGVPLLPLVGIGSSALLILNLDWRAIGGGLLLLAAGGALAWLWRASHARAGVAFLEQETPTDGAPSA